MSDLTDSVNKLLAEHEGTRTWLLWAPSREELAQRVTLTFAEHVRDLVMVGPGGVGAPEAAARRIRLDASSITAICP